MQRYPIEFIVQQPIVGGTQHGGDEGTASEIAFEIWLLCVHVANVTSCLPNGSQCDSALLAWVSSPPNFLDHHQQTSCCSIQKRCPYIAFECCVDGHLQQLSMCCLPSYHGHIAGFWQLISCYVAAHITAISITNSLSLHIRSHQARAYKHICKLSVKCSAECFCQLVPP